MTTMYISEPTKEEQSIFSFEENLSPSSSFFSNDLTSFTNQCLTVPSTSTNQNLGQGTSINTAPAAGAFQPYLSRPPSLSPSSQNHNYSSASHSPHSSASPSSTFSLSGTDELLFSNAFSTSDLDNLLFQMDQQQNNDPSRQPFYLPQGSFASSNDNNAHSINPSPDDSFDFLNVDFSARNVQGMKPDVGSQSNQGQSSSFPSTMQPSWMNSANRNQVGINFNPSIGTMQMPYGMPSVPSENTMARSYQANYMSTPSNRLSATMPATQPHTSSQAFAPPRIPPARKPAKSDSLPSPPSQGLGKHNKTERRYRRKVQAAQADLRDSVPALRVLYGSSTEEQLAMTDFRAPDGTVDGLGEINRPNASAKTTIFLGARMYIELLQSRVSTLQRKVNELEEFRMAVAGADDLARWQMDFDMRESEIQASMPVKHDSDELEDEEESEEEEPKRKRAKKASSAGNGRGFAAFALSLTLWPGASNLLGSKVSPKVIPGGESATSAAMITAEHVSRLLAMFIPMAFVPGADTLVSWTWKICLLAVLFVIIRAVIARQARNNVIIGNYASMAKDAAAVIVGVKSSVEDSLWTIKAAEMLGKVSDLSRLAQTHVVLRLNRSALSAYSLTLLALLQPSIPLLTSRETLWKRAQAALNSKAPPALRAVLSLPLEEAERSLELLPPTASPITGIAEQVTLVHINDMLARLFVRLVKAATTPTASSLKTLVANVSGSTLSSDLTLMDDEIKSVIDGVVQGTCAHALGLVLIGIRGVLASSTPTAQASLLASLTGDELIGLNSQLMSVNALIALLSPGTPIPPSKPASMHLPENAKAIDKLALVCIGLIKLLSCSEDLNGKQTRQDRQEASKGVTKATGELRAILTETTFIGLADKDSENETARDSELLELNEEDGRTGERDFELARVNLVGVLSVIGRRAARRATGRDEDSGLEGDLDEL